MDNVQEQQGSGDQFFLGLVEINLNFFVVCSLYTDVRQCFQDMSDVTCA